jgi:cytochrome c biogenesis protein CcmG/thiol:disulfide interchange protein DsbE
MAKKIMPFLPVIVFAAFLVVAALMLARGPEIHTLQSPMLGRPMPDFKSATLSAADIKGHPAVLVFFAGWCAPCIGEHPMIVKMAGRIKVPVYGIEYRDTKAQHDAFFGSRKNPYVKIADDSDGQIALAFGVSGVPTTMIVDAAGIIRYRRDMPMTQGAMEKNVLPLLRGLE